MTHTSYGGSYAAQVTTPARTSKRISVPVETVDLDTLLTFKEAMNFLHTSRSTVYRLLWSGQLTGHKLGSTWRFYLEDLKAALRKDSQVQKLSA